MFVEFEGGYNAMAGGERCSEACWPIQMPDTQINTVRPGKKGSFFCPGKKGSFFWDVVGRVSSLSCFLRDFLKPLATPNFPASA